MQRVLFVSALMGIVISLNACGGGHGSSFGSGSGSLPGGGVSGGSAPGGGGYNPPVIATTHPVATPSPAPTSGSGASATTTGFPGDVKIAQVNGRTILTDARSGLALYFFNGDGANQSNCTGSCLAIWPAHAASSSEKGDSNFSIFKRPDGSLQWAYKGHPLYTFISDTPSNNATGNSIQNFMLATPM